MPTFNGATTSEEIIQNFASRVKGRTFVITGAAANNLGGHTAVSLARGGAAHIIIVTRTTKKAEPVVAEIASADSSVKSTLVACDLTDFDQVRSAAKTICSAAPRIDVLINNAAVMAIKYKLDKQGFGYQLLLAAAPDARVVNVSSHGYRISPFRFDDWNFSGGKTYNQWTAYAQAKTAQILFTHALTKKFKDRGVTSTVLHPGNIYGTGLATHLMWEEFGDIPEIAKRQTGFEWYYEPPHQKSLTQGAATQLYAALDPDIAAKSPAYLSNCQIQEPLEYATNPEAAERLWELSEELVKQKFE
ncbi:Short-chain dehydrogenase TIC 32, chloroplastic [Cytospora mali]|uniref:Short-chain dehydrogenase TIC 32, chloroplastic n=1 Tax=Cytospora mali TaxID=578113 RepID=A0A194V5M3_CYTMA|nr:Short-chain dehydrogenase TIC 32, chloroplastic [Valsa mali var. pyri (nom. inval.)]